MKKLTVIGLIMAMSLSCLIGCGSSTTATESSDTQKTVSEEETEKAVPKEEQKKKKEDPVAEVIDLANMVLVDNEEIKVVVKSIEVFDTDRNGTKWDSMLNVSVENKTQEGHVFVKDAYINKLECGISWQVENVGGNALEIAAGETKDVQIELFDNAIRNQGGKPTDIVITFESAMDNETIFWSEHIYPYGEENVTKYEYELKETDVVVVDNESVRVIITECWRYTEEGYIDVRYFIENKTDGAVYFTTSDTMIDGVPWLFYHGEEVIPAGVAITDGIWLDGTELEQTETNIELNAINEITFTAWILDADTFTEDTFDDIDWSWRMSGDTSSFNPENYALAKEAVSCTIIDFDYE